MPDRVAGVVRILLHARPAGGDLRRRQGLLPGNLTFLHLLHRSWIMIKDQMITNGLGNVLQE